MPEDGDVAVVDDDDDDAGDVTPTPLVETLAVAAFARSVAVDSGTNSLLSNSMSCDVNFNVFSSISHAFTSDDDRKSPNGSTTVPRTVRPLGRTPDRFLASVQNVRPDAATILASCSMMISCNGDSSSARTKSKT